MTNNLNKELLAWDAPEHLLGTRTVPWKIVIFLTVVLFLVGGILLNSWTFSVAVAVFTVVYFQIHRGEEKSFRIVLTNMGVKIGKKEIPYGQLKGFWVIYNPPYVGTLNLLTHGKMAREYTIQLNGQDPYLIKSILEKKVDELKDRKESFTDLIIRIINI